MPNYQRGKIYKIVCNKSGLVYYGSTCEPTLARRLSGHTSKYRGWIKGTKTANLSSFKVLENKEYEIVLEELFPCNSKMELHKRERFFIENNNCVNICIPLRTKDEYRTENRKEINEKKKIYRSENKEKINENRKIYRSENKEKISEKNKETYQCECGCILSKMHYLRHKLTKKHIALINNKPVL